MDSTTRRLSLLDVAGRAVVTWWVAFGPQEQPHWFTRWLTPGFNHCFAVREWRFGPELSDVAYIRLDPYAALTAVDVAFEPPWLNPELTVMRVVAVREAQKVREWFAIGPPSCVETVKAFLGINKFSVRTPYQLYAYLRKYHGVLVS